MPGLTPKEKRFVAEYLKDQNGKQAAIRAGYAPGAADVQASRMLAKARVRAAVNGSLDRIAEKAEVTLEGHLRDLEKLRDEAHADGQFSAAVSAEVSRGKAAGLYVERVKHEGTLTLEQLVLASCLKAGGG